MPGIGAPISSASASLEGQVLPAWFLEKVNSAANHLETRLLGSAMGPRMARPPNPSARTLAGVALIVLLIVLWAAFVASLARVVGLWPILVQAAYYLFMGIVWIIPLKPLVRWMVTGSFRTGRQPRH
jgi:Protein of unknown function (DUF2842)